jgi:D-sedoheptulose 7-phosphate isomerase
MAKKFPVNKYESVGGFASDYFREYERAWKTVDMDALQRASDALRDCYRAGNWVFACGNGGSAAIANHFLCDHGKLIATGTDIRPKVYSLSSSNEMLTAVGNDIGFESSFAHPLENMASTGDVLFTVSASGDSPNIVAAIRKAKSLGLRTIALTAFNGGRSSKEAEINVHVDVHNYGLAEDSHQAIMHILAQYIRHAEMPSESVLTQKF